jgi:hypothetical protein
MSKSSYDWPQGYTNSSRQVSFDLILTRYLHSTEESEALATCFENPIIYRHDNGHIIPTNAEGRNTMFNFVKNFASTATVHM